MFARWIRHGGHSEFVVPLSASLCLEKKFSVVPERLLASISDDALRLAVERLNAFLPDKASINTSSVDTSDLEAELVESIASRLSEIGVPVNPNDPVIGAALRRYA